MKMRNAICFLAVALFAGCIPVPPLPPFVQSRVVPQAFEWQHQDISGAQFARIEDRAAHRQRPTAELFAAVRDRLDSLSYQPKEYSGIKATLVLSIPERDLERRLADQSFATAGRWGRYAPYPEFESVSIPVEPGLQLTGVLAVRDRTAPCVIVVSGTFDSRDGLYVRDTALLCYRNGYSVLVLEMRNHGQSIEHWATIGWKEGRDILAAAQWLQDRAIEGSPGSEPPSVAYIGYSLGAWYGIRAAYDASIRSREHLLDGGVISFNPPVDIQKAVLDWNRDDFRGSDFTLRSQVFKQFDSYLAKRVGQLGMKAEFKAAGGTFDAYVGLAARAHGISGEELYERAVLAPEEIAANVRVPVVAYHAEDDPVVGVEHSRRLQQAVETANSEYIEVIIREKGGHIGLHEVEPDYYVGLVMTVLEGLKR